MTSPNAPQVHTWIQEHISPWDIYQHGVHKILVDQTTDYQHMLIVEGGVQGRALVLDGKWQSCQRDEFLYHEPLVHPACVLHGHPRTALVLGGGEGATVRELLRWKTLERVVMVDIDSQVVEACKEHLSCMHQGAFDDPRTELVIGDALNYLDQSDAIWDVVISDLSDPIEQGPSYKLFTQEYFQKIKNVLSQRGVFVVQAGPTAPAEMSLHVRLVNTIKSVYDHVASYHSFVPTYASSWGYCIGTDAPIDAQPDIERTDALLAEKTTGPMQMFDGQTMLGLMQLPLHLRQAIEAETHVYTMDQPPAFYGQGVVTETAR